MKFLDVTSVHEPGRELFEPRIAVFGLGEPGNLLEAVTPRSRGHSELAGGVEIVLLVREPTEEEQRARKPSRLPHPIAFEREQPLLRALEALEIDGDAKCRRFRRTGIVTLFIDT